MPMILNMTLVLLCSFYAAVVAASYYLAALTAKPISFPNWVWDKEELPERRDEKRAA